MPISEPYTYFQSGELLFFLTYPGDEQIKNQIDDFDRVLNNWISFIDAITKERNTASTVVRCKDLEVHFAGTLTKTRPPMQGIEYPGSMNEKLELKRHGAFSLIPVEIRLPEEERMDGSDLVELMFYLQGRQADLQESLNKETSSDAIIVDTILLNWLASPASEYGGGGGPGARPEPYRGTSGRVPYQFEIPNARQFLTAEGGVRGKGVTVAILDTAPNVHDMAAAYERYHKLNPRNRIESHPLIESLFKPNGHFHVHPASLEDLIRIRAVHLRDHNYEMSDHGLFIAGIIHTIAPESEIHLYEVLNPNGIGDLLSIARGLQKVLDDFPGQALVINCSLVLNIPLLNHPTTNLDLKLLELIFEDPSDGPDNGYLTGISGSGKEWLARQGKAIEWICDYFLWQGARVVAAAGNDWRSSETKLRPQARFPAAFDSVLGVGALPKDAQPNANDQYLPASYSNLSDTPEKCGIATLGGEAGENNGILGVYLGEFPAMEYPVRKYSERLRPVLKPIITPELGSISAPKNENNWAWWSGTSFAAPIVTGLIASAFSNLSRPAIVEDAIGKLYRTNAIQESTTTSSEDGITNVRQVE